VPAIKLDNGNIGGHRTPFTWVTAEYYKCGN